MGSPSLRLAVVASVFTVFVGCRGCGGSVQRLAPSIGVEPVALDFGKVKTTVPAAELTLTVSAQTQVELLTPSIAADGAPEFTLEDVVTAVPALEQRALKVRFAPQRLGAFEGAILIRSNDPENPEVRVPVTGEGATPTLVVEPACATPSGCTAQLTASPAAIEFAAEAFDRRLPAALATLPTVRLVNDGPVELVIDGLELAGADVAAFSLAQSRPLPVTLAPGALLVVPLRFSPTSAAQAAYRAELLVRGDDVRRPMATVALTGALRPNLPPKVCLNLVRVVPGDGAAPLDYSGPEHWAPLLTPPPGGYDFTDTRDVQPRSDVTLSAFSTAEQTDCTSDPEDGRLGLTFQWRVVSAPAGTMAPTLVTPSPGMARLLPLATGAYVVELVVGDAQGNLTTTRAQLQVALKRDLVAQLSWSGFADVDLDLHLVRPSSAPFSFFDEGDGGTSGDVNGYAALLRQNRPGFDFDWGEPGNFDDPKLNLDDTGTGQLIETASLNYPEHDARCQAGPCTYGVYVHAFGDRRVPDAGVCTVGAGCLDGERCDCAGAALACVADEAPRTAAASGAGRCVLPPRPEVRLFLRGASRPAAVIPLETLTPPDPLAVPAPCHLLHVADVQWPQRGVALPDGGVPQPTIVVPGADDAGYVSRPALARYGWRQRGILQCAPNAVRPGGVSWYEVAP